MRFFNPKTAFFALAAAVLMVQCAVATTLSPTLELLGPLVREGDGPVIAYNELLARISSEHHGLAKKFWTKYAIPRYNRGLSTSGPPLERVLRATRLKSLASPRGDSRGL